MQRKLFIWIIIVCLIAGGYGCTAQSDPPEVHQLFQINERDEEINIVEETIRMNNCGGMADASQTAERSLSVKIEGDAGLGIEARVLQASIAARYEEGRETRKSLTFTAPPGTQMEFAIAWTERNSLGTIALPNANESLNYQASVPIAAELVSSMDLGCSERIGAHASEVAPVPTMTIHSVPTVLREPTGHPEPTVPPTIVPTPIPTTVPGTMLQDGETWYVDGWSLTVSNFHYQSLDSVQVVFQNRTGRTVVFPGAAWTAEVVSDRDNRHNCIQPVRCNYWGCTYTHSMSFPQTEVKPDDQLKNRFQCGSYASEDRELVLIIDNIADIIVDARWKTEIPRP